jgi:hypothetical protein
MTVSGCISSARDPAAPEHVRFAVGAPAGLQAVGTRRLFLICPGGIAGLASAARAAGLQAVGALAVSDMSPGRMAGAGQCQVAPSAPGPVARFRRVPSCALPRLSG